MTTLILVCLAYNPLSPDVYYQEMERANAVKTVIESTLVLQEPKEVKKVSTKKQAKKYDYPNTVDSKDGGYWQERIKYWCGVHGLSTSQCNTALRIAAAESGYRNCAKFGYRGNVCNINERILMCVGKSCRTKSSAAGIFMFVNGTWDSNSRKYGYAGASKYNGDANISVALQMMRDRGFSPWAASSHAR